MQLFATKNALIMYILIGYPQYFFEAKKLFRKSYKTTDMQYRCKREIKRTLKNDVPGYYLVKYRTRRFIPLTKLKKLLKYVV